MKPQDFIKSLIPDFDKQRITEDIRITADELRNYTLPALKQAEQFMGKWKFESAQIQAQLPIYTAAVKQRKANIIATINEAMKNAAVNLEEVARMIDRSYSDDIIGQGLTFFKANLLQFAEYVSFASRYARRYVNYVYAAETAVFDGQDPVEDILAPADIQWIEGNFLNFCNVLNVVGIPVKEVTTALDNIPDIAILDDNARTLSATVGEKKLDPLAMGFIPIFLNPIYHIRMKIAQWQTNRYHIARNEIQCLKVRKANLEALAAGKPNPKLQQEISYIETRIQGLMRKNAELEDEYGR